MEKTGQWPLGQWNRSSTGARSAGSLDLSIAISHLAPGPMQELGRKFQLLLIIPDQPSLMSATDARLGGSLDLTIAISRLTPGPMLDLGRHFFFLFIQPSLRVPAFKTLTAFP